MSHLSGRAPMFNVKLHHLCGNILWPFWFLLKSPEPYLNFPWTCNSSAAQPTFCRSHFLQNCQWFSGPVFSLTKSVSVIHGGIPTHISRSFGALWGRKTRFQLPCRWQNLGPKASPCDSWSGSGIRILWPKMTKEGPQKRLATFLRHWNVCLCITKICI